MTLIDDQGKVTKIRKAYKLFNELDPLNLHVKEGVFGI